MTDTVNNPTNDIAKLPALTKKESYLAAFEDDELLPIIANKKPTCSERDRLGLAEKRLGGGSLALHDELGEQLADVSSTHVQSNNRIFIAQLLVDVTSTQAECSSLRQIHGRGEVPYRNVSNDLGK
jgi:hypothetical protein